ncbi:MAG TPA: hypothetical protein PLF70_02335 [Candidatus Portnoybacteria bacterium]|mgnify:FL=1|jgi:hypothetical protein|nr:hypothetical protein [Candidatus Portnoybacteria bacterium]MDD5752297.1 hypothetical protein [Candidatus Portnoybacteria bacterium]HNU96796.1 hypothetical protein [Candidatus Portnoybacteria bacterium]HOZ16289.1 hypothetical protein [Candidatus Portnoybacteria bacterium]HPH51915.1 hypothetical protein [Candidatus Portnoybacteria bacterium]
MEKNEQLGLENLEEGEKVELEETDIRKHRTPEGYLKALEKKAKELIAMGENYSNSEQSKKAQEEFSKIAPEIARVKKLIEENKK